MAAAPFNPQIAGLYDLEETIGEGHYAVVKLARHVFTGEKVAVKVIDKMKLDAATRVQMLQEVQLMKLVQHPHVVRDLFEQARISSKKTCPRLHDPASWIPVAMWDDFLQPTNLLRQVFSRDSVLTLTT